MQMNSEWLMSIASVAALWAGGVTRFLSTNERARNAIWCRVPEGWRWAVPFANAFIVGIGVSLANGSPWKVALLETLTTTLAGGLGAVGGHEALKDSKLPYGSKDDAPAAADSPDVGPQTLRTGDAELIDFQDAATSLRAPSSPPKRRLPVPPPKPTGGNNAS